MLEKRIKTMGAVICLMGIATGINMAGGVGTTGAQFLKIGMGARPVGMGYAFSAVADDLNAIYWNPAGLALQEKKQVSASYLSYFQDVNIGFLGYAQPMMETKAFGVGLSYLTVGDIEKRVLKNSSGAYIDSDNPDGTFGANDAALYLSYADKTLLRMEGLNFGANLKVIRQEIDTESAMSFAADLAALYQTPIAGLNASLGVYNIGSEVTFVEEGDPLPLLVRLGGAYTTLNDTLLIALDVDEYVIDERLYAQLGIEYKLIQILSLRAGYKLGMDSELGGSAGLGTGIGFNIWNIQTDYAFSPFGELGDTHRISISTKF